MNAYLDQDAVVAPANPEPIEQIRDIFNELAFGERQVAATLIAGQRGVLAQSLLDLLEGLIDRKQSVIRFEDTVFGVIVDEDSDLPTWIAESIATIRQRLDLDPPFVLLDTAEDERMTTPFTHRPTRDFSFVSISRGYWNRETVQHEFAHAYLQCGIRFLDEGLADWFSDPRPSDPDSYKAPRFEASYRSRTGAICNSPAWSHVKSILRA